MRKIGYILAAVYAVFSLSVSSFAIAPILEGAEEGAETVASDVEDILGGGESSDSSGNEDDPIEGDTSDSSDNQGDPVESSDTSDTDNKDNPAESSDTSGTEAEVTTTAEEAATTTTKNPTNVGNAGNSKNPATGVVLGFTALGLAAAGLTAAAAKKRK